MADLLVVEDDETIGAALTTGLRGHGHAVVLAADRRAAPWTRPPAGRSTSCCSTSGCPTWTASRSAAGCGCSQPGDGARRC